MGARATELHCHFRGLERLCIEGISLQEAFRDVKQFQLTGRQVPNKLYYILIKRCIQEENLAVGKELHQLVLGGGENALSFLGSHLIRMFASCGSLSEAYNTFNNISKPTVFTWSAVISANVQFGYHAKAIDLYHQAYCSGIRPDGHVFVAVLKACGNGNFLAQGKMVHNDILESKLESVLHVANAVMDMYFKCRSLDDGLCIFHSLQNRDLVTWNVLLSGYIRHDACAEALNVFRYMQVQGFEPSVISWNTIISYHAQEGQLEDVFRCLQEMNKKGVEQNNVTWNALITAYTELGLYNDALGIYHRMQERGKNPDYVSFLCILRGICKKGTLEDEIQAEALEFIEPSSSPSNILTNSSFITIAKAVFEKLQKRPIEAWNAMIAAYAEVKDIIKVLQLFEHMQQEGAWPNNITYISILKAVSTVNHVLLVHAAVMESTFDKDTILRSSLIHSYCKFGSIENAQGVFDGSLDHDVVIWTTLMGGYAEHGRYMDVIQHFCRMQCENINPNRVTFLLLLKICSNLGCAEMGYIVHFLIIVNGLDQDVYVGSALVDMHAKGANFAEAQWTFHNHPSHIHIAWNAMILGCAQRGYHQEAIHFFWKMWQSGLEPNQASYVSLLKCCSIMVALDAGRLCHANCIENGHNKYVQVNSALVDMYSKCGSIEDAYDVVVRSPIRDLIMWNAIISGYAKCGDYEQVLRCFNNMQKEKIKPDGVTFLCLLSACSHLGLRKEGILTFFYMMHDEDIASNQEHYNCMVELLGNDGDWTKAHDLFSSMPMLPNIVGWTSLLNQWKRHIDIKS